MVRRMYSNKEDNDREFASVGEIVKLTEISQPILGGECDLYTGFIDKKGKTVYVPNGTILSRKSILKKIFDKNITFIHVKKGKFLNSCMDYHEDEISFFGADNEPISVEYGDKFRILGSYN